MRNKATTKCFTRLFLCVTASMLKNSVVCRDAPIVPIYLDCVKKDYLKFDFAYVHDEVPAFIVDY